MVPQQKCTVNGCDKEVRSVGLCCAHYYRNLRHGSPEQTRPDDWGKREKHPLYSTWINLRGYPANVSKEWLDNFWLFVSDVVERPSKDVFLKRLDEYRQFGKDNFIWAKRKLQHDGTQDGFVKARSERFKEFKAKSLYKITPEKRREMFEKQNNLCAVCGKPETRQSRTRNKVLTLAVDHCHKTGKIRELLCSSCNQGLGQFKDDVELLRKAIDYLMFHNRKDGDS